MTAITLNDVLASTDLIDRLLPVSATPIAGPQPVPFPKRTPGRGLFAHDPVASAARREERLAQQSFGLEAWASQFGVSVKSLDLDAEPTEVPMVTVDDPHDPEYFVEVPADDEGVTDVDRRAALAKLLNVANIDHFEREED